MSISSGYEFQALNWCQQSSTFPQPVSSLSTAKISKFAWSKKNCSNDHRVNSIEANCQEPDWLRSQNRMPRRKSPPNRIHSWSSDVFEHIIKENHNLNKRPKQVAFTLCLCASVWRYSFPFFLFGTIQSHPSIDWEKSKKKIEILSAEDLSLNPGNSVRLRTRPKVESNCGNL